MNPPSDVSIRSVNSTVRAVDGSSLLTPSVMQEILRIVLQEVEEWLTRQRRIDSERRVTPGVAYELDQEER
jgi:hypothetical protein